MPLNFGTSKYLFPSPPLGGPIVNGADICLPTINTGSLSATHHSHSSLIHFWICAFFGSALDLLDLKYLEMKPSNMASESSNICQIYWDTSFYRLLSNESISKHIIPNVVVGWDSKSSRSLWTWQSRLEKETCKSHNTLFKIQASKTSILKTVSLDLFLRWMIKMNEYHLLTTSILFACTDHIFFSKVSSCFRHRPYDQFCPDSISLQNPHHHQP